MTTNRPAELMRAALAVTLLVCAIALGGCSMSEFRGDAEEVANPMSDEQAEAQVVDVGRQLRTIAGLQDVGGGFSFESCNDQGEPPYRGLVEMSAQLPAGTDTDTYARQVADAMVAAGWTDGPPPGKKPYGTVIHRDGVMVVMGPGNVDGLLAFTIQGECRNTTDHRDDGKTVGRDITAELLSGS
ncbi:hypothetical protein AU195_24630 [Mycobacterium sp. IS-1496]|uniref:hypothetical protein n=1 Tax=Mycobacterium sp. IS-1496 TaxID=1772284 RepID=UPI0007417CBF|nr:hypothetical protein [Mycobacterium sp. IS-1496]KUI30514.1 hypothetical protein AU195_24630 [Mycobacterium sp. IS-1496]